MSVRAPCSSARPAGLLQRTQPSPPLRPLLVRLIAVPTAHPPPLAAPCLQILARKYNQDKMICRKWV